MSGGRTICTVCGYIYDEALGEPIQNIPPLLGFEDLLDDWRCPGCGSAKEMFRPCSCVGLPADEQRYAAPHFKCNSSRAAGMNREASLSKSASVGHLVAQRPLRGSVLEQFGIDYCCAGKASLEDACAEKGLRVEQVLEKLLAAEQKSASSGAPDWLSTSLKDLIEHILTAYHEPLRQELARLVRLAEKVAGVHGDSHPEMIEVMNLLKRFRAQLELHMQKEEMVLFPAIASMEATGSLQIFGCGGGIEHPIDVMAQEHDEAAEALSAMRRLTHDYTPPDGACSSFRDLLTSLARIESEMHQHVHKENNILFPRALELRNPAPVSR